MTEEIDRPPAGMRCVKCDANRHFCQALAYEGDTPVCLFCADGVDCPTMAARRRLNEPPVAFEAEPDYAIAPVRHLDPATVTIVPVPDARPTPYSAADGGKGARSEAAKLMRAVDDRKSGRKRGVGRNPMQAEKVRRIRREGHNRVCRIAEALNEYR